MSNVPHGPGLLRAIRRAGEKLLDVSGATSRPFIFSVWYSQRWLEVRQVGDRWTVFKITTTAFGRQKRPVCLLSDGTWGDVLECVRQQPWLERATTAGELVLPVTKCYVMTKTIPAKARSKAAQILRIALERTTPFKSEDVLSAVWTERLPGRSGVNATLAIAKVSVVKPWVDDLVQAGLRLSRLSLLDGDERPLPANLLAERPERRPTVLGRLNRVVLASAGAAVGLAAVAMATDLWRKSADLERLSTEIEASRKLALAARVASNRADAEFDVYVAPRQRRVSTPTFVAVWDTLTQTLPQSTWLSFIALDGSEVRIEGFAESAAALIPLLSSDPRLSDVAFLAPVVRDEQTTSERFQIRMTLKRPSTDGLADRSQRREVALP